MVSMCAKQGLVPSKIVFKNKISVFLQVLTQSTPVPLSVLPQLDPSAHPDGLSYGCYWERTYISK